MRERRPGVWEIRIVVANEEVTGRSVQRSVTVHGDAEVAEVRRRELVERFGVDRSALYCTGARLDVDPRHACHLGHADLLRKRIDGRIGQ